MPVGVPTQRLATVWQARVAPSQDAVHNKPPHEAAFSFSAWHFTFQP